MELKVWVEGIQRIVCGVTVNTTCQDVVFALAHATGKVGRFTLIERWRNNERLLAPNENPLKLLIEWGEYANDVQFILQRSENKQQQQQHQTLQQLQTQRENANANNTSNNTNSTTNQAAVMLRKPLGLSNKNNNNNINNNISSSNNFSNSTNSSSSSNSNNNNNDNINSNNYIQQQTKLPHLSELDTNFNTAPHLDKTRELKKKSFGAHDVKHTENIGIVKGIPQRPNNSSNSNSNNNNSNHANIQNRQATLFQKSSPTNPNASHLSTGPSRSPIFSAINNNSTPPPLPQLIPRHEKSHSNPIEMSTTYTNTFAGGTEFRIDSNANNHDTINNNNTNHIYSQLGTQNSKSINEINLAVVRESLDRRITAADSPDVLYATPHSKRNNGNNNNNNNNNNSNSCSSSSSENLLDIYNGNVNRSGGGVGVGVSGSDVPPDLLYKNAPTISANGALVPPPYRDPPPPRNSPLQLQHQQQQQQHQLHAHQVSTGALINASANNYMQDYSSISDCDVEFQQMTGGGGGSGGIGGSVGGNSIEESESIFQATQYNDLLQLIKFQREKISVQQLELNKYDAEIVYLESKERDQAQELEAISREITKADQIFRQGSEQLQTLQYVEEENELVKQQEKTLKSEIALLRSKLANCETELLQCKNKIRLLMNDIEVEQRGNTTKQKANRQNVERDFLMEMERIQSEIDQAIHNTDTSNKTAENLKKEILLIENAITEKKRQVEQLVNQMKEVNLQSLTVTTSEEIKHFLEGPNKPGSSRRIIGSPRQLENAVPTSKNPHGVWV